jgi:hypothetical protein
MPDVVIALVDGSMHAFTNLPDDDAGEVLRWHRDGYENAVCAFTVDGETVQITHRAVVFITAGPGIAARYGAKDSLIGTAAVQVFLEDGVPDVSVEEDAAQSRRWNDARMAAHRDGH